MPDICHSNLIERECIEFICILSVYCQYTVSILSIHPGCVEGNFQYTPALEKIMAMALLRLVKNKTKSVKICNKIAGTGQKNPKFCILHAKKVSCLEKSAPQPVGFD